MKEQFLEDIFDNPGDTSTRLIYADWLEENGQPDRGEFIRTQCSKSPLSYTLQRFVDKRHLWVSDRGLLPLLREMGGELLRSYSWGDEVPGEVRTETKIREWKLRLTYRRGFIDEVGMPLSAWMEYGPKLVVLGPLTKLTFTRADPGYTHGFTWYGDFERVSFDPDDVPYCLLILLNGQRTPSYEEGIGGFIEYKSRQEALDDLSRVALLHAQGVAKGKNLQGAKG